MEEYREKEKTKGCRFRPMTQGCVMHDPRLARAAEELYIDELTAVCAASYRAMMVRECDVALSELLFAQMRDEIAHFQYLGELILALGGNPVVRAPIRVDAVRRADDMRGGCETLTDVVAGAALRDKKRSIDCYQTLMGRTEDRVVRVSLMYLIDEEERHAAMLVRHLHQGT